MDLVRQKDYSVYMKWIVHGLMSGGLGPRLPQIIESTFK